MYLKLYMCLHIVALVVVFVLPHFLQMANFVESTVVANRMSTGKRKISNNDNSNRSSQYCNNEQQNFRHQHHLKKFQGLNNDITSYCSSLSSMTKGGQQHIDDITTLTTQIIDREKMSTKLSGKIIIEIRNII